MVPISKANSSSKAEKAGLRRLRPGKKSAESRGAITLEVILALPVLFIATLAVIEFGILFVIYQTVVTATIEGARVLANGESDPPLTNAQRRTLVSNRVNRFLAVHDVKLTDTSSDGNIRIQNWMGTDILLNPGGQACYSSGPALSLNEVRVTVSLSLVSDKTASSAWATRYGVNTPGVPNLLKTFGFTLVGKRYEISSLSSAN